MRDQENIDVFRRVDGSSAQFATRVDFWLSSARKVRKSDRLGERRNLIPRACVPLKAEPIFLDRD